MALYLGLELGTDQLRASIIDENLELSGVESVDYDTELSEYGTQGGIFTTPGEAYTTPVEMWIKALDLLLEKLHRNYDLSKIKAIGGSAQHALVWWKSIPLPSLSSLDPHLPLHAHFPASSFALPNTPTSLSTASHAHALAIEALLGGPDAMKARVGVCASPGLAAGQMLRVRESLTRQVWERTGRVQMASAWLCSMIAGKWAPMVEQEAVNTGIWTASTAPISRATTPLPSPTTKTQGGLMATAASGSGLLPPPPLTPTPKPEGGRYWDEGVLDIVGGSREEGRRVRGWLGEVDVSGKRIIGPVGKYLVERYGFESDTIVTPFIPDFLATYLSFAPHPGTDTVLHFGPMDLLMTEIRPAAAVQNAAKSTQCILFPHPVNGNDRRYISVIGSRNADVARALVRDMYTKSWSAFDRLVAIVPPGGSIGLDDKLFAFWHLTSDSHPYSHVKGIYRFETGIKVNEFRDLRANPRCLVESQILSMRVKHAMMFHPQPASQYPPARILSGAAWLNALGMHFDPTSINELPKRILATGGAANFPSIVNLIGDVFHAPVLVPMTQVKSAGPEGGGRHRNAPQRGFSGRAGIGAALIAWFARRDDGMLGGGVFEEEVRKIYDQRWEASDKTPPKASVLPENAMPVTPAATTPGSRSSYPGTPTNFTGRGQMMGLGGTSVLVEEDEEDMDYLGALRPSLTTSTDLTGSLANSNTTNFTSPDLSLPNEPTPLTTVSPSNSTTEEEVKEGLARVAEPDMDGFLAYAGILSEFVRLESGVLKGVV